MKGIISINERGIVFSIDFCIASLAAMGMLFLFLFSLGILAEERESELRAFALKKNALFLLDSMVKNCCGHSSRCLASADLEKKRVLENVLDEKALGMLQQEEPCTGGVERITLKFKNGEKRLLFQASRRGKNCYSLNRFVFAYGKKALLELRMCGD